MDARPKLSELGDRWYAEEEPTRVGLGRELRRLVRRGRARPRAVLALATLLAAAVMAAVIARETRLRARVVLALTEGALSDERTPMTTEQLRAYATSVLLSDRNVLEVIETLDLYPRRHQLGPQYALEQLWAQAEVAIGRNTFFYFLVQEAHARKSARIVITVFDPRPTRAFAIARGLGEVAVRQHREERRQRTGHLAQQVELMRAGMSARAGELGALLAARQAELARARQRRHDLRAAALTVELTALASELDEVEAVLRQIAHSQETAADAIAAAGLDVTLAIVDERRPERPADPGLTLALTGAVVAFGALLAAILVIGAFDPRVHDGDDLARLGLPVLGHLPAFPGDHVGALSTRGLRLPREGLVKRWS